MVSLRLLKISVLLVFTTHKYKNKPYAIRKYKNPAYG